MIKIFKASLLKSKTFMRQYEIDSDITLFDLHTFLQNDLAFSPDQMAIFKGLDDHGKPVSTYGLFDMGNGSMDSVSIDDLILKSENDFRYIFDLKHNTFLEFKFIKDTDFKSRTSYPRLIAEKGINPNQFSGKYEDVAEILFDSDTEAIDETEIDKDYIKESGSEEM
ncbi:MAG: hypothetical protein WC140_07265 [Bacteroidales bacterium]